MAIAPSLQQYRSSNVTPLIPRHLSALAKFNSTSKYTYQSIFTTMSF